MVWGTLVAECVGETHAVSEEEMDGKNPQTPPTTNSVSGEVRDTSGRFSSMHKLQKQQQKDVRTASLLKRMDAKRKLQFDGEERKEDEEG